MMLKFIKLLKSQVVNILAFLAHMISAESTRACDYAAGVATVLLSRCESDELLCTAAEVGMS